MTNKRERLPICPNCGLYSCICICKSIHKILLKTRITLLIHDKEIRRLTNTGRFAGLCLENSSVFVKGRQGEVWDEKQVLPDGYAHRILFPFASETLSPEMKTIDNKPLNLIVPDGTWSQAKKIVISEPYLHSIKRVKLPPDALSSYHLRKADNPEHISTLEAIARALGIIENGIIREELESVFTAMTTGLIKLRGYK